MSGARASLCHRGYILHAPQKTEERHTKNRKNSREEGRVLGPLRFVGLTLPCSTPVPGVEGRLQAGPEEQGPVRGLGETNHLVRGHTS